MNAVLRRAAHERTALVAGMDDSTPAGAAVLHSYPEWLARMWWQELGPADARAVMAAMNQPAETALRVNTIRADPDSILGELRAAGDEVERPNAAAPLASPESLVLHGRLGALARRRLEDGALVAQARGSQAVVALLDPKPGERVLDLCAAPGIKTTAKSSPWSSIPDGPANCAGFVSGSVSSASGWSKRTLQAPTSAAATIGSSWIPPAPISVRSAPGPMQGGESRLS